MAAPATDKPEGWPAHVGLIRHSAIDSTNEEARRLAQAGEQGPVWIVAQTQSAGRGRRGRSWMSERGNLFTTHLFAPRCPLPVAAQISFVAALAVHDAVADVLAGAGREDLAGTLTLKWPNDLLLGGAKMSGILIETAGAVGMDPAADPLLAVGIGVNVASHPADTPYPATSLADAGAGSVTPLDLLTALAASFEAWCARWAGGAGFAEIRAAWLGRAQGLGGPITVRLPEETLVGEFVSLGEDGALRLRIEGPGRATMREVSAGDVFFPGLGA